jgi:hypothetical protein
MVTTDTTPSSATRAGLLRQPVVARAGAQSPSAHRFRSSAPAGLREVGIAKFFVAPELPLRTRVCAETERDRHRVSIPKSTGLLSATYEVRQREVLDWPLAACFSRAEARRESKGDSRPGSLLATSRQPRGSQRRSRGVADWQDDQRRGRSRRRQDRLAKAKALSRNGYKIQLAQVAVKRALLQAVSKA